MQNEIKLDFKAELDKLGKLVEEHDYELDGHNKYIIYEDENYFSHNAHVLFTIEALGGMSNPDCKRIIRSFNAKAHQLCPSGNKNDLEKYYGAGYLWKNSDTQGIVVKLIDDDIITYEILVECSRLCTGFKYTKFIPTDAECYNAAIEQLNNLY